MRELGETVTYNYDMANRLLSRDYRTRPDSPGAAVADSDSFTYDDASRLLTADSGIETGSVPVSITASNIRENGIYDTWDEDNDMD